MTPTERKALKDVISALKVVKDRVLKNIHNVQECWGKAAERFKKDVESDRAKKKIKRKASIAYFMGRKLKTGKFNNWAPATPDSIGQTVLVVGRGRATMGKRKLIQVIFGLRVDGVVTFEKQDKLSLCFEDEQYRPGSKAAFKNSGALVHQFPLRSVVVEQFYHTMRMHSADYVAARCLFICLSVCHTPILSLNGYRCPQSFFTIG